MSFFYKIEVVFQLLYNSIKPPKTNQKKQITEKMASAAREEYEMEVDMPLDGNVTDRSEERRERMRQRHGRWAVPANAWSEKEKEMDELRAAHQNEMDRLRAAYELALQKQQQHCSDCLDDFKLTLERKEEKILDLRGKFSRANTRISVLTAAIMENLQSQWDQTVHERTEDKRRNNERLNTLRERVNAVRELVDLDHNQYARARLDHFGERLQNPLNE